MNLKNRRQNVPYHFDYASNSRPGRLVFWAFLALLACRTEKAGEMASGARVVNLPGMAAAMPEKMPIYQYYQKIPRISGVTNDSENLVFELKVELGYEVGDKKALEKLGLLNSKIAGQIRYSMARKSKVYLQKPGNYPSIEDSILNIVNEIIAPNPEDPARVRDVIIADLLIYDYR